MHGVRRVVTFCVVITILPTSLLVVPLYLRHYLFADVAYAVTESDILEVNDGISTIFCSKHTLRMNGTFNAFQMSHKPEITSYRKHIRLKKSMILPDDTLEYWGFYLLKGATVALSVCSRFQGASLLVVKGERNLRTCGMLQHNNNKARMNEIYFPKAEEQVKITFATNGESRESPRDHLVTGPNNQNDNSSTEDKGNDAAGINGVKTVEHKEVLEPVPFAKNDKIANATSAKRKLRHARKKLKPTTIKKERLKAKPWKKNKGKSEKSRQVRSLEAELNAEMNEDTNNLEDLGSSEVQVRSKRSQGPSKPIQFLDEGIKHGGNNALKNLTNLDESSVSSFENGLLECYEGNVLLAQEFAPSPACTNVEYLVNGRHMQTTHNVAEDGYYYYIFYSDNDFVSNDIYALFDIYKPTFQYENITNSCVNSTQCTFTLSMLSDDRVIVEIPTNDGIEHELDEHMILVSVCHPRMGMYIIFPTAIILFILTCAFV